jgi:hypothetical protein
VVDWVHQSRLENRCDVPVAVGKLKSQLVSAVIYTALKDIRACPAAVLEFCYRQGDRLTAQCFYWLIQSNCIEVAKVAIDRIPKANIRRELCQYYVEEKPNTKKSSYLLQYCSLFAVIAPKYNSITSSDDLVSFYASKMFRRGGLVDDQSAALLSAFSGTEVGALLPFVESLQRMRKAVVTEGSGVSVSVWSVRHIPSASEVQCLY